MEKSISLNCKVFLYHTWTNTNVYIVLSFVSSLNKALLCQFNHLALMGTHIYLLITEKVP